MTPYMDDMSQGKSVHLLVIKLVPPVAPTVANHYTH
jgi:hypothetical protein